MVVRIELLFCLTSLFLLVKVVWILNEICMMYDVCC